MWDKESLWECKNCNKKTTDKYDTCWNCGYDKSENKSESTNLISDNTWVCKKCNKNISNNYNECWICAEMAKEKENAFGKK